MAINYGAIRADNKRDWPKIDKLGPLLAGLYADRTHLLFELLQNAEDALRRRRSDGPRSVTFEISEDSLRVRHYGEPFNESDVRSICGIAESTKQEDKTAIGRFGIGFKSVYAWTDRPEIHSAGEHFAIEMWVHPTPTAEIESAPDETVIVIPFKDEMAGSRAEIVEALQNESGNALLFLREIEEIAWSADGESSGRYLCERKPLDGDDDVHLVTIIGAVGSTEPESSWLMFSEPVEHDGTHVGHVEIAFTHVAESGDDPARIEPVSSSPLSAYFPTALETHFGFLMQGPYRTTPARDNVPPNDEWNIGLVAQTAALLKRTLPWLRDHGYLTADALACMPIDERQFTRRSASIDSPREPTRFYPLFQAAKDALSENALLPAFSGDHVRPEQGLLGGTEALRKLFSIDQLKALLGLTDDVAWLDPKITANRARNLYDYLHSTLGVHEVNADQVLRRLDEAFLEQQPDEWIRSLYEFLNDRRKQDWFADLPLIRLEDGTHVAPGANDAPHAYLPTSAPTDFPTVRRTVCDSKESLDFLKSLGLREPDLVDDVEVNILPSYLADHVSVDASRYERDVQRIIDTYKAVDGDRRGKLVDALRRSKFVCAIDAGNGETTFAKPSETYTPTDTLQSLFDGLTGVLFVDRSVAVLQSEDAAKLLAACGVGDHIRVLTSEKGVDPNDPRWVAVRKNAGWPKSNRYNKVRDRQLDRLGDLLTSLSSADAQRRQAVARLLWDELRYIVVRDRDLFYGQYMWFHYQDRSEPLDTQFVKQLNTTAWVPSGNGKLLKPRDVTIESLGWPRDSFVEERIRFREPADRQTIKQLAEKVGVSVEAVRLMEEIEAREVSLDAVRRFVAELGNDEMQQASAGETTVSTPASHSGHGGSPREEFRSRVGVRRDPQPEADSEAHARRMALEAKAIRHILESEPEWEQTEPGNPGFDLYQTNADGQIFKWCEIKSLSESWAKGPVTMSHTQFKLAQEKGDAYWLYVVEHAGAPEQIRLLCIQDPAGQAKTFTFDQGWEEIADAPTYNERDGTDASTQDGEAP